MKRNCPDCNKEITYKNIYVMRAADRENRRCNSCKFKHPKTDKKPWSRKCPDCETKMFYRLKHNRDNLEGRLCKECGIKKMSNGKKGKSLPHLEKWYQLKKDNARKGPFILNCINCNKPREYKTHWSFQRAQKEKTVCNSCSSILYKKSWTYVIKDKDIKKMAATKAGYSTFDAYMNDFENKKAYWSNVKRLTKHRNIKALPNYDKLRGVAGTEGAYQLDHIISISEGYRNGIPPEEISDITNLQIIPWQHNLNKSNKNDWTHI